MELDQWQKDVLSTNGNIVLRSGRQVGKSTIISIKSALYAIKNAKKSVLIISATERQAYLLFSKVLAYIHDNFKKDIKSGKERPTKSEIKLKNGSIIRCLPTGLDGLGIRGYTVDLLIADEAAFIPEDVWAAVTPMLATTGGNIILLSTPRGDKGYFYNAFHDDNFTKFHISHQEVAELRAEPQRTNMLENLEKERKNMSKMRFQAEYLGEFITDFQRVFNDELLKKVMCLKRRNEIRKERAYFIGVDVAGFGEDDSTFEILDRSNREAVEQVENIVANGKLTTETAQKIIELDNLYNMKGIGIDDAGLGFGVFSELQREKKTRDKTFGLNNAKRLIETIYKHGKAYEKKKGLMKEEMYENLKAMMERNRIKLLDDSESFMSLASCQYDFDEDRKKLRIVGNNTHIAEGLIRAAWLCEKDKSLNIWAR